MKTKTATKKKTAALQTIAAAHLGFETLESRGADMLDFKEVSVWSVAAALEAAYEAGKAAR